MFKSHHYENTTVASFYPIWIDSRRSASLRPHSRTTTVFFSGTGPHSRTRTVVFPDPGPQDSIKIPQGQRLCGLTVERLIKNPQGQRLCGLAVEPGRFFFRIWALVSRRIRLKAARRFKQLREGRLRFSSCYVLHSPMDDGCAIGSASGQRVGCGQTSSRRPQPVTVWRRQQSGLRYDQCTQGGVGHRVPPG